MLIKKDEKSKNKILKISGLYITLIGILILLILASLCVGSAGYSISEIIDVLFFGKEGFAKIVIFNLRLPRIVLAILIGASLSVAGALLQAVMRNPLADPGTIGVSAGAGTAATTILLIFPNMMNSLPIFAFGGALLTCALIYFMAWKQGIDPVRIILSGVAINSVLGAYNGLLQMLHSDNLSSILAFLNGSLSGRNWGHVKLALIYAIIGLTIAFACTKSANVLQLGDEMAKSLGFKVSRHRIILSAVSAFLAAATVTVAGMIGFVGLVVPHIARMIVGSDHKVLLPTSCLIGSIVLLAADTLGRTIIPGMEIPVGIVMAVTGGPFFLYLLRRSGKKCF